MTKFIVSHAEINEYYRYLLHAFQSELRGNSRRQLVEDEVTNSIISRGSEKFLRNIVRNAFAHIDLYQKRALSPRRTIHPLEVLNYIVLEGYTPSSPFVLWAHRQLGIHWSARHWFAYLMRDIALVDVATIRREFRTLSDQQLPPTLELYYRLGIGLERPYVHPDIGIKKSLRTEFSGVSNYKGFDPLSYLYMDSYYGLFNSEDMTIIKTFYHTLLEHRGMLSRHATALIVGNGPAPYEAYALAMIPEIHTIIPADVDERNNKIMQLHTGRRNPLATQKARPGEEQADYIYYLFEQASGCRYGFFAVREITSVKTIDPIIIDIAKPQPLGKRGVKADIVVVPFCPESITSSFTTYRRYLQHIAGLVSPGKQLCMLALKNAHFYNVGGRKLAAVPIDEALVTKELLRNGFTGIQIKSIHCRTTKNQTQRGFSDSMVIWAVAR